MQAVLLTEEELTALQALVKQQGASHSHLEVALAHPLPDLAEHLWDLNEVVNRARDGSSYIDEDFGDLLDTLAELSPAYDVAMAARKAAE